MLLLLISAVLCFMSVAGWQRAIRLSLRCTRGATTIIVFLPLLSLAFVLLVLRRWADVEVRGSVIYILLLLLLAAGWLGMATFLSRWLGISLRDDVAERNNRAALAAWGGVITGLTLVFAGANVGEGPSLWNNVFSAVVGTITLAVLWFVLETLGRGSTSIAVDRDIASGLRLAGFLASLGLVLGRALAGDWHSMVNTMSDFVRQSWPVLFLTGFAAVLESPFRPSPAKPTLPWFTHGAAPALVYIVAAGVWVATLGPW